MSHARRMTSYCSVVISRVIGAPWKRGSCKILSTADSSLTASVPFAATPRLQLLAGSYADGASTKCVPECAGCGTTVALGVSAKLPR